MYVIKEYYKNGKIDEKNFINENTLKVKSSKKYKIFQKIDKELLDIDNFLITRSEDNLEIKLQDSVLVLEEFYKYNNTLLEITTNYNSTYIIKSLNYESEKIDSNTELIYAQGNPSILSHIASTVDNHLYDLLKNHIEFSRLERFVDNGEMAASSLSSQSAVAGTIAGMSVGTIVGIGVAVIGIAAAAGGGGSSASSVASSLKGFFVDSAVGGVDYYIDGVYAGKTGSDGSFNYTAGQTIVFKIGNITIGSIDASEVPSDGKIMPQDIVGVDRNDVANAKVIEIARLLQTLDSDGDATNGITVDATRIIDTTANIEEGTGTLLGAMSFQNGATLVSADNAQAHLMDTMKIIQIC